MKYIVLTVWFAYSVGVRFFIRPFFLFTPKNKEISLALLEMFYLTGLVLLSVPPGSCL